MRLRSRLFGALPGTVCTIGAATMFVAMFLPYIGWYGDGLPTAAEYPNQVYTTLITGSDVVFVLGTVITLVVVAACHVAGFRRRINGFVALAASLVAMGLAVKLPGTYLLDGVTYGTPYFTDAGVHVFLDGAVTSSVGALLMAVTGLAGARPKTARALASRPT